MKIPKQIKIGGHIYKIIYKDGFKDTLNDKPGICKLLGNKIFVNKNNDCSLSQQEESLIHEIIEAINYNYQLDLSHQNISILGSTIYQVLKDNKLLK